MLISKSSEKNIFKVTLSLKNTLKRMSSSSVITENTRPEPDKVLKEISNYIHNYNIDSCLAYETAKLCLLDSIGCGLAALKYDQPKNLIKPTVPGTIVPNGTRIIGTSLIQDPIRGAFSIGTLIRWLDYNDCWLAAEWGHPSDNLGGILAISDYLTRSSKSRNEGKIFKIKDVLDGMIRAHEIQGILALENSFNNVGLDHVALVKIATTAVVSKLVGLSYDKTIDALSHAFADGQSLRTYRHVPNTMSRKSWAAGDAVSRAVNLVYHVKNGESGMPSVLTAKRWGFYDVSFKGQEFIFQRPYGSYVMENILFKISFPAEFHAQTAMEASLIIHKELKDLGRDHKDIKSVKIRTQEAAMKIIDKKGPLHNYADRDHCIQYMVAIPLIYGRLTADDYGDAIASNPAIDELREKMYCVEDKQLTVDYYDPLKRYIGNSLTVEMNDGTILSEVKIDYPIGHRRRREEGKPLLFAKFEKHVKDHFEDKTKQDTILRASYDENLENMEVDKFVDLFIPDS